MADIPVAEMEELVNRMEFYGVNTKDQTDIAQFLAAGKIRQKLIRRPTPGMKKLAKRIVLRDKELKRLEWYRKAVKRIFAEKAAERAASVQKPEPIIKRKRGRVFRHKK